MTTPGLPLTTPAADSPRRVLVRAEAVEQLYDKKIAILGPLDLDVFEGEFLALVGPSGGGKSTLLRLVAGLLKPSRGVIRVGGKPLRGVNRQAAVVFQSFALFPWMSVIDNVSVGLEAAGFALRERLRRAEKYIHLTGLTGYERAYPKELSRGMKQLVGIARALALEPELLCLDEPFSALDVLTARTIRERMVELWGSAAVPTKSILLVTHSIEEAALLADRVVILRGHPGLVVESLDLLRLPRPRNAESPALREVVDRMYSLLA